jgi:hypothetical protein
MLGRSVSLALEALHARQHDVTVTSLRDRDDDP